MKVGHPYAVRGQSPRQIMEHVLSAYREAREEGREESNPALVQLQAVNAALEALKESGAGFCDVDELWRFR